MPAFKYQRHQPEFSQLYQLVATHYPKFKQQVDLQDAYLPKNIDHEFQSYLKCGLLEYGFFRLKCISCKQEKLLAFSCKGRGFCPSCGASRMIENAAHLLDAVLPARPIRQWVLSLPILLRLLLVRKRELISPILKIITRCIGRYLIQKIQIKMQLKKAHIKIGALTLIQRFGSALNLNPHFHMLFLEGAYQIDADKKIKRFIPVSPPKQTELESLVDSLSKKIAKYLERKGFIESSYDTNGKNTYLRLSEEPNALEQLSGASITYKIATGKHRGQKVFSLQTAPPKSPSKIKYKTVNISGFNLNAVVFVKSTERKKLERLCRYITRPPIAETRIKILPNGNVRYLLKTPYANGTTHVIFEPLDFIAKLVALVPPPRLNLIRYHGVFAPNSPYRKQVVMAKKENNKSNKKEDSPIEPIQSNSKRMNWAQKLKRAFNLDLTKCQQCKAELKVIACIENPLVIEKILKHLNLSTQGAFEKHTGPPSQAPPIQIGLFD
jgi:hypothetical protein